RPCIVFRRTDIDKHSALLKRVNSPLQNNREHVLFEARRTFGNVLEDGVAENVHPSVDETGAMSTGFFGESYYAACGINPHHSVTPRICDRHNRHTRQSVALLMEPEQLVEIYLDKRVTVHDQKLISGLQMTLRQL